MIEVDSVHKAFGGVVAVENVSFRAEDGRITGLLGPNGAGKTTTLRMLYAVLAPDRGHARVDGFDVVTQADEVRRRIGVLPDARGLYPRLTAREHVRYFGRLQGVEPAELERRITASLTLLDMHAIADRRADGLSMGERLKVAIARALVHEPQNVVLDEPTNGLDVMSTRAMREVIRRLRDDGRCVVLSSHVMQEVGALCDEVVVVARGKVVARGSPDDLKRATGRATLEDAFVAALGTDEGVMA